MAITLNGSTGITTPAETASTSVTTPIVTSPAATALTIQSAGTTAMTVDTSQNVGIGKTNPVYILDILKNGANGYVQLTSDTASFYSAQYINGATTVATRLISDATSGYCETATNHPLIFRTNATERARIDTSGNLLVGTTSSNYTGAKLSVTNAGAANQGPLGLINSNSAAKPWTFGPDTNGNMVAMNGSALGAYITYGANGWSSTSDERLKDITDSISNGVAKVCTLRAVTYTWKSDSEKIPQVGLIAQDVQKVLPEAVSEGSDGYLGVRYTEIVPLLVAAIKELSAKNDALEARLAALEAK